MPRFCSGKRKAGARGCDWRGAPYRDTAGSAHVAVAALWGLLLCYTRLLPRITDGIYFTAMSITTLGYGDILLKSP